MLEKNILYSDDKSVANIFNTYFNRVTEQLNVPSWECQTLPFQSHINTSLTAKFQNHPSMNIIKTHKAQGMGEFEFSHVKDEDVFKVIMSLNNSKSVSGNIPTRILKASANICVPYLTSCFNSCIDSCEFPDELKLADIIPSFKKGSPTDKGNYRPISLLPVVSKVFERLLANQLEAYLDKSFSKLLCGFRKSHSTQHSILHMLRKWQNCIANKGKVGAILIDLSKVLLSYILMVLELRVLNFCMTISVIGSIGLKLAPISVHG